MQIRALIVDDEPLGREAIRSLLMRDPQITSICEAGNGREALKHLDAGQADVMFLDVHMPDIDGISLLGDIEPAKLPTIVFVTAHEQFAVDAFNNNAVDYLLKPVGSERFSRAMLKAKAQLRSKALGVSGDAPMELTDQGPRAGREGLRHIAVRSRHKVVLIDVDTVNWIGAADDYVEIHTAANGCYLLHGTLSSLVSKLDSNSFMRIHRSAVIRLKAIKEIVPSTRGEYDLVLKDGTALQSGRTYGRVIRKLLANSL